MTQKRLFCLQDRMGKAIKAKSLFFCMRFIFVCQIDSQYHTVYIACDFVGWWK